MVLESEFTADERVEKEIKSLHSAGFQVSVAAYTFVNNMDEEKRENYTVFRRRISKWTYKSSAASLIIPLYFRFWFNYLDDLLKRNHFDVIHVHDLPLSKVAWKLAVKYNLWLVCDQHEYYSNWIVRTAHMNTLTGKLIRCFSNWKQYEKYWLGKADLVITVEDKLKKIYIENVKIAPEKIISLPNTPNGELFNLKNIKEVSENFRNSFVIFYAGGIDEIRGFSFILSALSKLKKDIPNILFLVAGKENRYFNIAEKARMLHVEEHVQYLGWVPLHLLPSYIAVSNVCLFVPKADNMEINNTIATKIYQYAAMGKPVIVSEAQMMKEFVEQHQIGKSIHYGNIDEFYDAVKYFYDHPELEESIKNRAIQIASGFTWESTSADFIHFYQKMIQ